jgi:DNA-binding FadR family transcriptional regulator
VAALRAEGILISRRGSGVFVSKTRDQRPFRIAHEDLNAIPGVVAALELRSAVEMEAASLAARRRTKENIEEINAAYVRIDQTTTSDTGSAEADFAFHMAIARATYNSNFPNFLSYLGSRLIPRQQIRIKSDPAAGDDAFLRMIQREHRDIEQAIRVGDAVGARDAMRRHLVDGAIGRYELWATQAREDTVGDLSPRANPEAGARPERGVVPPPQKG